MTLVSTGRGVACPRWTDVTSGVSFNCNQVPSRFPGSSTLGFSAWSDRCPVDAVILESCHSTWIFDAEHKQFCRILKGVEVADRPVTTEWRPYSELHLDPGTESFTVYLNAAHTRQVRSWRHTRDCDQCGGRETAELSLDDIRRVVSL
jgi:hypothetical protein